MEQTDIDNFLNNGIGTANDLTFDAKRIALHFSVEIWNDMRRYDFDLEIFLGWDIPAYYYVSTDAQKTFLLGNSSAVGCNVHTSATTTRPIYKPSVQKYPVQTCRCYSGIVLMTYGSSNEN